MTIIENHIGAINRLCLAYKVKRLSAFGSVLTSQFSDDSDIDLIVDFEPISQARYANHYYNFKFSLEDLFQKPVDLLEENAIKNPYFQMAVASQKQVIYEH